MVKGVIQITIAFTPKYRRKIIYNPYRADWIDIIKQLCAYKNVGMIEGHMMPDHMHLLVSIPPQYSNFIIYGISERKKCMDDVWQTWKFEVQIWESIVVIGIPCNLLAAVISYIPITNKLTGIFGQKDYYVSTSRVQWSAIRKYFQEQEKNYMIKDKLRVKEYEDPSKGQGWVVPTPLKR